MPVNLISLLSQPLRLHYYLHFALSAVLLLFSGWVIAQVCATPAANSATTSIAGIINSYYPGSTGNVPAGTRTIAIGAIDTSSGGSATPIAAGDLLIVMQMQGAEINFSNSDCYGDGVGTGACATYTLTTAASYAGGNLATNYRAVHGNTAPPPQPLAHQFQCSVQAQAEAQSTLTKPAQRLAVLALIDTK